MSYIEDLQIDKLALDIEWERQPHLYMKYAEKAAHAQAVRDRAKETVEIVRAELDAKIRRNPLAYTGEDKKPTETQIHSLILMSNEYKSAQENYISACEDANVYMSARSAFEHRKTALEFMCKLFLSGYWADPRIKTEEKEGVQKGQEALVRHALSEDLAEDMAQYRKPEQAPAKKPLVRRKA